MNKGVAVLTWFAVVVAVFFLGVMIGTSRPDSVAHHPTTTPIVRVQRVYVYPTPTPVPVTPWAWPTVTPTPDPIDALLDRLRAEQKSV